MAAKYRKVDPRFWADEKVQQLSPTDKLIGLYVLTGQCNRIGVFTFKIGACADDTGIPIESCRDAVRRVCDALGWHYDDQNRVMYLPRWWKYNGAHDKGSLPEQNMLSLLQDVHDLPECGLLDMFLDNDAYLLETPRKTLAREPQIRQSMADRGRRGGAAGSRVSTGGTTPGGTGGSTPGTTPGGTQEQEQEQDSVSLSVKFTDEDKRFAEWMLKQIKAVAPRTKEPDIAKWADTIRLMREQDGRTLKEAATVFVWANRDEFWKTNILSPRKFREKYGDLHAKAASAGEASLTKEAREMPKRRRRV